MNGITGVHQAYRGRTDEWLTPPEVLASFPQFDLDPCASVVRPWPTAKTHYTIDDDGLKGPWQGRVYMNPPYGPELTRWLETLAKHGNGIALTFARTETKAFTRWVWPYAKGMMFLFGRLHFYDTAGTRSRNNSGGPSVLIAYGDECWDLLSKCGLNGGLVKCNDKI